MNKNIKPKEDLVDNDYELTQDDISILDELEDDEAVIEIDRLIGKNDKIVEKDYLSSLLEQEDRMIFYEVENIYKNYNSKRYRNKFSMRKDPPVLIMKDDIGNEVEFNLTENLIEEMEYTIKQVKRAYLGYSGPENLYTPKGFVNKIIFYAKNNPVKTIFPIIIIISAILITVL